MNFEVGWIVTSSIVDRKVSSDVDWKVPSDVDRKDGTR